MVSTLHVELALWWLDEGLVVIYRMSNLILLIIESLLCNGCPLVSINMRPRFPFILAYSAPDIYMSLPKTTNQAFIFQIFDYLVKLEGFTMNQ